MDTVEDTVPEAVVPEQAPESVPAHDPVEDDEDMFASMALDSASSLGNYLAAARDGTLGDMDDEDAFELASNAALVPSTALELTDDLPDEVAPFIDPVRYRDNLLAIQVQQQALSFMDDSRAFQQELRDDMVRNRRRTMFTHSLVPEDVAQRIEFDYQNGDRSPMLKLKEQYFFD